MGLIENFKKGRDAAYAARGFTPGGKDALTQDGAAEPSNGADAADDAELSETRRKLVEELSAEIEKLQKRVGEAEAERDEAKKLLAEVVTEGEERTKRIAGLETERDDVKKLLAELTASAEQAQKRAADVEAERDEAKKLLAELTASAEQLQRRIAELETEPGVFAEVLLLPGVRKVLLKLFHPDTHPDADEDQRRALTEGSGKINAAYALIDKGEKA